MESKPDIFSKKNLSERILIEDSSSHSLFNEINKNYLTTTNNQDRFYKIIDKFLHLRQKVSKDIDNNWPTTQRRVGGYNIDLINTKGFNSSHLLVGSEGTLSLFNKIKLKLSEIPKITQNAPGPPRPAENAYSG